MKHLIVLLTLFTSVGCTTVPHATPEAKDKVVQLPDGNKVTKNTVQLDPRLEEMCSALTKFEIGANPTSKEVEAILKKWAVIHLDCQLKHKAIVDKFYEIQQ